MRFPKLVFLFGAAALSACVHEDVYDDELGEAEAPLSSSNVTFKVASIPDEECRVHTSRLNTTAQNDATRWRAGTQLLILRDTTTLRGMCTVNAFGHSGGTDEIQVNQTTMNRRVWLLADGSSPPTSIAGVLVRDHHAADPATPPEVAAATETIADLDIDDDLAREYLLFPAGARVAYTAPHPWENMGPTADGQVGKAWTQLKAVWAQRDATDAYWAMGMQGNDGDKETGVDGNSLTNTQRFHITSTAISELSFPSLGLLIANPVRYAVAFHGTASSTSANACNDGTKVGGGLGFDLDGRVGGDPYLFRRGIAENIRMLVDPSDPAPGNGSSHGAMNPAKVRYVNGSCANSHDGTGGNNFVNRIARYTTAGGALVDRGIQLETGANLDPAIYGRIGLGVREVFDCLDAPAERTVATTATFDESTTDVAYASDRCRGWVLDATLAAGQHTWTGGLATCTANARAHVDIYRRNQLADSWDRVGGGEVTYADVGGTCTASYTAWDDPTDSTVPVFEPGGEADVAGDYRMVVYGYTGAFFTPATALPVRAAVTSP